jgi:hypothetical protein
MSERDSCPHELSACNFAEKHELTLARKILQMIENYTKDNRTYPCPKCLRNSIIAIAALLHLEEAKINQKRSGQNGSEGAGFAEAFAEAARERMLTVMDAVADLDSALSNRRLM